MNEAMIMHSLFGERDNKYVEYELDCSTCSSTADESYNLPRKHELARAFFSISSMESFPYYDDFDCENLIFDSPINLKNDRVCCCESPLYLELETNKVKDTFPSRSVLTQYSNFDEKERTSNHNSRSILHLISEKDLLYLHSIKEVDKTLQSLKHTHPPNYELVFQCYQKFDISYISLSPIYRALVARCSYAFKKRKWFSEKYVFPYKKTHLATLPSPDLETSHHFLYGMISSFISPIASLFSFLLRMIMNLFIGICCTVSRFVYMVIRLLSASLCNYTFPNGAANALSTLLCRTHTSRADNEEERNAIV